MAAVPLVVISVIGFKYALGHPVFHRWFPAWTRPFVVEDKEDDVSEVPSPKWRWPNKRALLLLLFSVVGFLAALLRTVISPISISYVLMTVSWVSAL